MLYYRSITHRPTRRGGGNGEKSRHDGVGPGADRGLRAVPSGERPGDHDEEGAQGRDGQGVHGAADLHLDGPDHRQAEMQAHPEGRVQACTGADACQQLKII